MLLTPACPTDTPLKENLDHMAAKTLHTHKIAGNIMGQIMDGAWLSCWTCFPI